MSDTRKMVKAAVVAGSYTPAGKDTVYPAEGDDPSPVLDVPEDHLKIFNGILVPAAIAEQIRASMPQKDKPLSPPTASNDAVVAGARAVDQDEVLASKESSGNRRR